jgi:hypothetical protein
LTPLVFSAENPLKVIRHFLEKSSVFLLLYSSCQILTLSLEEL